MADTIGTTLGELVEAEQSLRRVAALPLRSKDVPDGLSPKSKYHIVKLARLVAAETRHFTDLQAELFTELGIVAGQPVSDVKAAVWAEYQRRIKEHAGVEVTLSWGPVKSSDIPMALATDIIGLGPLCELVEPKE